MAVQNPTSESRRLHAVEAGMDLSSDRVRRDSEARDSSRVRRFSSARSLLSGSFAFLTVTVLSLMHGGYFATAWGWGSLTILWLATITLVFSERVEVGRLEWALIGGLAAFLTWSLASWSWSVAPPAAMREVQRGVLLLSAILASMLLARRQMRPILGGVLAGVTLAASYGLATRLFPERLGTSDAIAGYRLAEPLGYWNGVGLMTAMGILLSLGFAARGRSVVARAAGSAAPILLFPTMFFTYSRGAWFALLGGYAVALLLDRRRVQLITTALLLAPFISIAVWLCWREPNLNRRTGALAQASSEGHRLALSLLVLTACAALIGPASRFVERALVIPRAVQLVYRGALVLLIIASLAIGFVRYGSPQSIAHRAYVSFTGPPIGVSRSGHLSDRFLTLSNNGRLDLWDVALDSYRAHPLLGSGAGTFEYAWMKDRPGAGKRRDAHNLYLEVLGEVGPLGLAILLFAFALPVAGAIKSRSHPLVPIALGTYAAFLLHAGVDWDWEMPALTIAGLLCGVAILVVARPREIPRVLSRRVRIVGVTAIVAVGGFAFVGLMGNLAIAKSNNAAAHSAWKSSADHARDAKRWMPWSSEPWRLQGEAQYGQGNFGAARANFRKAIAKDPNNWLLWADLATVGTHGTWRAPARRALELNPLAPELAGFRKALRRGS